MSMAEAAAAVIPRIQALIAALGLPSRLAELGVSQEDIPQLAELAHQDVCLLTNPCPYSLQEIENLYREAW